LLSVVIPATDSPATLGRCLAALVATAAALRGRGRPALAALVAMLAPNARFYALLARRGGPRLALSGVPLHLVHHLIAAASVPVGAVLWARRSRP